MSTDKTVPELDVASALTGTELLYLVQGGNDVQAPVSSLDSRMLSVVGFKRVRMAASGNINIASAPSSTDGIAFTSGDRVLLWLQSTTHQNGIYIWNGTGVAMTRATDADTDAELRNSLVLSSTGANYAGFLFRNTNTAAITVGTTSISFVKYPTTGIGLNSSNGGVLNIANTAVSAGSYVYGGNYSSQFTVNQQGQLTAATTYLISIGYSQIYDFQAGVELYAPSLTRGKIVAIAENQGA